MSDQSNIYAALFKLSSDMAKAIGPAAEAFSPENIEKMFPTMPKDMMEMFLGKGINKEALDAKTRLFLTLQGLIIQGALAEPQLRLTLRHLVALEATDQEIMETIALAGLFGGAPGVQRAMAMYEELKAEPPEA